MCLHEGHKVGDAVEQVIWVKVQDPIILDDSGGHHDLHLADTSVHRVPRQLGLKNREQVAPGVQGRQPVPVLEPVAIPKSMNPLSSLSCEDTSRL